jgi:hypothetical protein
MQVLPKRLGKYGLTLHPEKTRLIDLEEEAGQEGRAKKPFDFLDFTHFYFNCPKEIMGLAEKRKAPATKGQCNY